MKTFIVSLCVFSVLLGLIAFNAAFIHRTTSTLKKQIEELTIDSKSELMNLEQYWKQKKTLIGLSVSSDLIRDIDERIAEIHTAIAQEDEAGLEACARLALVAIERMRHNERCSIDNLL